MPYVGDDVQARKRRWEDETHEVLRFYAEKQPTFLPVSSSSSSSSPSTFFLFDQAPTTSQEGVNSMQARKILPLSKRPRTTLDDDIHLHEGSHTHRRRSSHGRQQDFSKTVKVGGVTLTPCHVCHRKPTKRSHLDSFAECQGCGERTCYVCIRQCHGGIVDRFTTSILSEQEVLSRSFHMDDAHDHGDTASGDKSPRRNNDKGWAAGGHRSMVCSRCCVEKGAEGDIVCLGCLSGLETT